MAEVVYLHDRFVDPDRAVISVRDRGYLTGDGVFVTMRGYDGICFRAERHIADLARGAELFGIELPDLPLADLAHEAARRTAAADAYVRLTLTRGPAFSILARPLELPSARDYELGIAAVTSTRRRIPCFDPRVKTTSYAPQILARREAEARGAADAIQWANDGTLASGAMSNLFLVCGDELLTPGLESGCRAGVTREVLLELAPRVGLRPFERRLDPALLWDADEAFFTSTRIECLPIASVDGKPVAQRRHQPLRAAFRALVGR